MTFPRKRPASVAPVPSIAEAWTDPGAYDSPPSREYATPSNGYRRAQLAPGGIDASAREDLSRLGQISILLLIAAVLAMGAAIWQRRPALAALRIQSFAPTQLWRVLLLETGLLLGAGCLTGALTGMATRAPTSRWWRDTRETMSTRSVLWSSWG